ncbi:MAG: hypothetical protein SOT68_05080 [Oscillospiraceae bacterium]|nr:hypothetical protein [Oscillospiraceae bacterium]MDD7278085.1 hypothetical protein [Oscillospiraceae bacterium]MDY2863556.1 hypothetical protein [Oscillospiraceae bacterium]
MTQREFENKCHELYLADYEKYGKICIFTDGISDDLQQMHDLLTKIETSFKLEKNYLSQNQNNNALISETKLREKNITMFFSLAEKEFNTHPSADE